MKINIEVEVDAEDLINQAGEKKAREHLTRLLKQELPNIRDVLFQNIGYVSHGADMIPVAIRHVTIKTNLEVIKSFKHIEEFGAAIPVYTIQPVKE